MRADLMRSVCASIFRLNISSADRFGPLVSLSCDTVRSTSVPACKQAGMQHACSNTVLDRLHA